LKFNIYEKSLTAHRYHNILENTLAELCDEVPLVLLNQLYFLQEGALAQNAQIIRQYLFNNFPDRWISTHDPVEWPARSQDLSVLDVFLWGYLKNKIYVILNTKRLNFAMQHTKNSEIWKPEKPEQCVKGALNIMVCSLNNAFFLSKYCLS
jgi:hypothetical protein